jgi:UDP-sugar pyrophosphorylase
LDSSYPGGLAAYLSKAKVLLKESADGTNPFDEYSAVVPTGEVLSYPTSQSTLDTTSTSTGTTSSSMTFPQAEEIGLTACRNIVVCLVAGGLGERLGYSGIKLSLSTDLCTDECYLSLYAKYILALQYRARKMSGSTELLIPLVIMTSGDTDAATRQLLRDNANFGLSDGQVTVVMQDKVAALCNGNAGLALEEDDRWCIQTKPHGHGDVHHLMYREGLVDQWEKEGKTHIVFIQDTNALVINSILPTLGVSVQKGFHMNSICIPRLAGEAAGAITRLE